jgi:DNA recombination protein RmuC
VKGVNPWLAFLLGSGAGALVIWLWMRTRVAELRIQKQVVDETNAQLGTRFQSLADAALRSTLDSRQIAVDSAVKPLNDTVARLESHLREVERERQKSLGSLGEQLQTLTRETGSLATALRSPQARGRWGEITLRRVAELSGMIRNCDFLEQQTRDGDNGRIRPDMIVQLPGGRSLVVDAKVPLTAYLDAMSAKDEPARKVALQRHAQQLTEHVKQLSSKQYWGQFQPAPELVVLFLPGDHLLSAALEQNPDLIEEAIQKKIVIATPVTLISILKGIAYGWKQEQLAENAEQIRRVAVEFYDRVQTVQQYYADAGRQLEKSVECYNRSVASWDARMLPALRKLQDLGISEGSEPVSAEVIDVVTRRPRAVGE